jgi:CDGSH-type Zn-finger protein
MKPSADHSDVQPPVTTIRCRENGPLVIELPHDEQGRPLAAIRVNDHLGQAFQLPSQKRAVALCRCGHSATRPFCDGSHRDCGFLARETASNDTNLAKQSKADGKNSPPEGGEADSAEQSGSSFRPKPSPGRD